MPGNCESSHRDFQPLEDRKERAVLHRLNRLAHPRQKPVLLLHLNNSTAVGIWYALTYEGKAVALFPRQKPRIFVSPGSCQRLKLMLLCWQPGMVNQTSGEAASLIMRPGRLQKA